MIIILALLVVSTTLLVMVLNALQLFLMKIIEARELDIRGMFDYIPERRLNFEEIDNLEELPEAEPMLPGHTLLRPSKTMLKSAAKFPSDDKNAVYGNYGNLGITFGKTSNRVLYTGFRKRNDLLATILNAIKRKKNQKKPVIIFIDTGTERSKKNSKAKEIEYLLNNGDIVPEENVANEISDEIESEDENGLNLRRKSKKTVGRDRSAMYNTSSASSESSLEYEGNPGNPYTIFQNKYKQNWMSNHVMDGDHMNINPYGPKLNNLGPSAAQLLFNRKWWYYNQDDFKPLG